MKQVAVSQFQSRDGVDHKMTLFRKPFIASGFKWITLLVMPVSNCILNFAPTYAAAPHNFKTFI